MIFSAMTDPVRLANGVEIPCIGYGTWQTPTGGMTRDCVKAAIAAGYRHIDTAFIYGNEDEVGDGVRAAGIDRHDLFITSKHWVTERGYKKTAAAIDVSLKNLGMDYLDLYLIHWPCVAKVDPAWEEINADTWRAFEDAYKAGKLRAIGVSNFQEKHLRSLMANADVSPMVDQIEFHPGHAPMDTVRFVQANDMVAEAWSPLGSGAVLGDPGLAALAAKYGKSVAQLCVRFALQNGVVPLPKSTDPARMRSNAEVFDFEISPADMETLLQTPTLGFSGYLPEDAPADALAGN
ncbi:MAG: aldo/keto reductase [Clostridia bacterium]|nr:aldo/keto reductase [Clostridia bacterium]